MKKKYKYLCVILFSLGLIALMIPFFQGGDIAVLNPKGMIGVKQKDLIILSSWLMLIVVIPVLLLTFWIPWKYRKDNKQSKHDPNWDYNLIAESIWWGIPCVIVFALSIIVWRSSHELDPFKPIDTGKKPLVIQAVALQWKWLFIYPEQGIATVNYVQFPEKTPLLFCITADAPMNSFWIPKLGGQIYAMPGMKTKLYLIADEIGEFRGSSANLSGKGFAGMNFVARATSENDFDMWVQSVRGCSDGLNLKIYNQLAEPSEKNPPMFYRLEQEDLYDQIVMKYGMPMPNMQHKD